MPKVSQSEIAKVAQVSRNTVSLALRNSPRLPAETRERIQKIARQMGYQPNPELSRAMAALVASRGEARETLALVYLRPKSNLFQWSAFPLIRQGFLDRASELGFGVDEIDFAGEDLSIDHLHKMLRARGIRGVGLLGAWGRELPEKWRVIWQNFALVSASAIVRSPAISNATAGFFHAGYLALQRTVELGYKRPALVINDQFDRRLDFQLTHGFLAAAYELLDQTRPPVLMFEDIPGRQELRQFLDREQPDCLVSLPHESRQRLEKLGIIPGRDIGLACLDYQRDHPDFAGVDLRNELSGTAAVDLLVGQLSRNEIGLPFMHKTVASNPVFRDGPTLPPVSAS